MSPSKITVVCNVRGVLIKDKQFGTEIIEAVKTLQKNNVDVYFNTVHVYCVARQILQTCGLESKVRILNGGTEEIAEIIKEKNLQPSHCIFIDDNSFWTSTAEEMGMQPVLWKFYENDKSIRELQEHLDKVGYQGSAISTPKV